MRKAAVLAGLLLFLASLPGMAQDYPKYEIFGGYSYLHGDTGGSGVSLNLNGWNASLSYNVKSWAGLTADFDGHYGTPLGASFNLHNFLFGPTFSHRSDKWSVYVHTLFGASRAGGDITSVAAFGMALGGGVDVKVRKNLALRVVQADYLMTRFDPGITSLNGTQNNFRLSTGVVFHFQ